MNINKEIKSKRQDILRIATKYGVQDIRVFGSVARGQSSADSDLDVLVRLKPGYSLLDLIAIKQDMEDLLGCGVDVVTEAAISPYIREEVLKEAVSL